MAICWPQATYTNALNFSNDLPVNLQILGIQLLRREDLRQGLLSHEEMGKSLREILGDQDALLIALMVNLLMRQVTP